VAKTVGITVCVTSGMPAGREGPMVHAGSILAAGLARGYSDALPFLPGIYNGFDNTRDRRDFVSMGAAAGVAAAFNAPIGGILFSLEEVSSVWSGALTWQTFVCAIVAAYTVNLLMASGAGSFSDSSLVLFGHDDCGEKSGE
jgi:H+/Cl- antiporter ClcA